MINLYSVFGLRAHEKKNKEKRGFSRAKVNPSLIWINIFYLMKRNEG